MRGRKPEKPVKRHGYKTAAILIALSLILGAVPWDVQAAEEETESVVAETGPETGTGTASGSSAPAVEPEAEADSGSSASSGSSSGEPEEEKTDSQAEPAESDAGEETAVSQADSTSLEEEAGSLSQSSRLTEEEIPEDAEQRVTAEAQILVEGSGSVKVVFCNAEGQVAEALVSSDSGHVELAVAAESEVTLIPEPDKAFVFAGWRVLADAVGIREDHTFTMPAEPVQITAVFVEEGAVESLPSEGASPEAQAALEGKPEKTNAALIAEQHIAPLPVAKPDFRFWHIDREVGFVKMDTVFREETSDDARIVARVPRDAAVFLLEDTNEDWYYAESGEARGFIRKERLTDDENRAALLKEYGRQARRDSTTASGWQALEGYYTFAEVVVPAADNQAFLYRKCTSYPVVVEERYALTAEETVNILTEPKSYGRVAGILHEGDLAYVIADEDQPWIYVESGDVRGFVRSTEVYTGFRIQKKVERAGGAAAFSVCTQKLKPEENKATYYTRTSIKEGNHLNPVRDAIIRSAEQCLGHPYVWGGTSLLGGCDCSGFVQGLYRLYGYSIPRVAENQARYGRQIPVDNARPGDLIFFAKNGYVYHVALYVGNDQTIEAYDSAHGIIRNRVDHTHAVWATHVIED